MWTAGLTFIEPASKFESNLPKTCRAKSARFRPYSFLAHSLKSSVISTSGVALTIFASRFSKCGTLLHISRSKCSSRMLSMLTPLFSCNFFPVVSYAITSYKTYDILPMVLCYFWVCDGIIQDNDQVQIQGLM